MKARILVFSFWGVQSYSNHKQIHQESRWFQMSRDSACFRIPGFLASNELCVADEWTCFFLNELLWFLVPKSVHFIVYILRDMSHELLPLYWWSLGMNMLCKLDPNINELHKYILFPAYNYCCFYQGLNEFNEEASELDKKKCSSTCYCNNQ